jgi:signal transduction histidine kinase
MSRLPIRVRMTAAFALAMVIVLAATALFAYVRLEGDLDEAIDTGLRSRSDDVAALIRGSETGLGAGRVGRLAESEESFVQVLRPDGSFVDGTTPTRVSALRPEDVQNAFRAPILVERSVAGVDATARMLARPVATPEGFRVVVAGASLEDRNDTLSGLLRSFLIGGPIAVLLASGIGYLLASAGFAPVEAMRRRAEQISLTRGGERLPLPAAQDEIRRLGETLNEMLARLAASFERERRFVADASHELRTPLATLKTELEAAIRSEGDTENVREALVAALEETDQLAQLAEDLLVIAQAADGRLPVRFEQVEVRELLERTRHRFADRAHEQGRDISVDAPSGLTASIDPLRGRQALGNLIDNALRHGGGDIRLAARKEGADVEFEVSDTGPGFADDMVPRAFERFARGDGARTRGGGAGAGLGLAIVRTIAEAHGGTATIAESSAAGATVRLRIPVAQPR